MVEKGYKISKYHPRKQRQSLDTYEPESRLGIRKERAVPFIVRIGNIFLVLGGIIAFLVSGIFFGIRSLFGFKKKVNDGVSRFRGKKYLEIKVKNH